MKTRKVLAVKMNFDPKKYMMNLKGKDYLPVAARLIWFREEHPDWGIVTDALVMEQDHSIFKACIFNAEGKLMATAHKKEDARGFPDHAEKAETGSIGRALALCGYGTQFADDFDEGSERIVDTPQKSRSPYQARPSRPSPPPPLPEETTGDTVFGADEEASNVRKEEIEDYSTILRDFMQAAREAGVIPDERLDRQQVEHYLITIANEIDPDRTYKDKMPNAELLKKMRTHYRRRNGQAARKDKTDGQ